MLIHKWAVRLAKTVWFLIISFIMGRSLAAPETYLNHHMISKICRVIYGDVNAETMYETYTNIDILTVLSFTLLIYFVTATTLKKLRR